MDVYNQLLDDNVAYVDYVTIIVYHTCPTGGNTPPVAVDDTASVDEDSSVTIDVAANDGDVDGNLDPTSVTVIPDPSNGTAVSNGDGTIDYTPN
jgi:hypothetical protein